MLPEETLTYEDYIGVGTNTNTTTSNPFLNINGGTSSGSSGGIFGSLSSILTRASSLALTAPKPEEKKPEEKKPETQVPAPVAAPFAEPAASKIKPWMWYTGAGVVGLLIVAGFVYFRNR